MDRSPAEVMATLLDEDRFYLCSERTMDRVQGAPKVPVQERFGRSAPIPSTRSPSSMATAPNQVWSWDAHAAARHGLKKWTAITTSTSSWTISSPLRRGLDGGGLRENSATGRPVDFQQSCLKHGVQPRCPDPALRIGELQ